MLERREQISEIGQAVLRPGLVLDGQTVGPLASGNRRLPFAVAAVEYQHGLAGVKPQHIAEIVALVPLERDGCARRQGGVDEQAWAAKVEFGHLGCSSPRLAAVAGSAVT